MHVILTCFFPLSALEDTKRHYQSSTQSFLFSASPAPLYCSKLLQHFLFLSTQLYNNIHMTEHAHFPGRPGSTPIWSNIVFIFGIDSKISVKIRKQNFKTAVLFTPIFFANYLGQHLKCVRLTIPLLKRFLLAVPTRRYCRWVESLNSLGKTTQC